MIVNNKNWRELFVECPTIQLDGKTLDHVIEADDGAGYALVYEDDGAGGLALDESRTALLVKRVKGRIEIVGKLRPWVQ